jgi:hypothetical protein
VFEKLIESASGFVSEVAPKAIKDKKFLGLMYVVAIMISVFLSAHWAYNTLFAKIIEYTFLGYAFPQGLRISFVAAMANSAMFFYFCCLLVFAWIQISPNVQIIPDSKRKKRNEVWYAVMNLAVSLILVALVVFACWNRADEPSLKTLLIFSVVTASNFLQGFAANLLRATSQLFNKDHIGEGLLRLVYSAALFGVATTLGLTIFVFDRSFQTETTVRLCNEIRAVSVQYGNGVNVTGWLMGERANKTFVREKMGFGIYQNVAIQNSAIATITDFSNISFPKERKWAFPQCEIQ